MPVTILYFVGFLVLALSSRQIGGFFSKIRLPLITGYLSSGILFGPFGLGLIPSDGIEHLRFVDEVALAVIAFVAGNEFYLAEMRSRMRSVTWVTTTLVIATYLLGIPAMFFLADSIPFVREMGLAGHTAVALLGATILVTRSPSSAVAIIRELRAKGPYTKTALGVTVGTDVVVIVLFGFSASLAGALLAGHGLDFTFALLIVGELALSVLMGFLVGRLMQESMRLKVHRIVKVVLILAIGYGVFVGSDTLRHASADRLPFEIFLEPLLICMIASFLVTNYSRFRVEFGDILEKIGPPIFVAFFTLTGASMELNLLAKVWPITLGLVAVRLLAIWVGSFAGGIIAGDPMPQNRLAWMGYITQAGIGLGLAQEVAVEFPEFGAEFATIFISVIVLNQFIGPPFFKYVLRALGESHLPGESHPDEIRDALILGIEGQSMMLARQLQNHGWKVAVADTDHEVTVRDASTSDAVEALARHHLDEISSESLAPYMNSATDAMVAMLHDDAANLRACEIALEDYGVPRVIVRLNDPAWSSKFQELGVLVVDPALAMVNLLDRVARAPWSALFLQDDAEHDTVEITITDPDLSGLSLRDLRMPEDVLVLSIYRRKHWVVPHGYTVLRLNDKMTLMGSRASLDDITRRFGY